MTWKAWKNDGTGTGAVKDGKKENWQSGKVK